MWWIDNVLAKFWWQKGFRKNGIHWCQWKHLCRSKEEGGMGFKDMAQFNITLLAKQGWRILDNPKSLVTQFFKVKYFSEVDFLKSTLGNNSSYIWWSLWATKGVLVDGLYWKVGTGTNISVYNDAWIPYYRNFRSSSINVNLHDYKVVELFSNYERKWNRELIVNTFPEEAAEKILCFLLIK